jgi:hypothetical protein
MQDVDSGPTSTDISTEHPAPSLAVRVVVVLVMLATIAVDTWIYSSYGDSWSFQGDPSSIHPLALVFAAFPAAGALGALLVVLRMVRGRRPGHLAWVAPTVGLGIPLGTVLLALRGFHI